MISKLVNIGSPHDCGKCGKEIPKGGLAVKFSRRAETYRERCCADQHGKISWYYHPECKQGN